MKVLVVDNYNELSAAAAEMLADTVKSKPDCVLGLATGSTPIGTYEHLIQKYNAGELDFSRVKTINLDEYYPISPNNDQSYRYFMNTHLFDSVNIDITNTNVPDGLANDPKTACRDYEALIDTLGGADVQLLGIGRNGHIGFNEPSECLEPFTHLTNLSEDTVKANSRFFENEALVPTRAITMGMRSIFKAKRIIILASGKDKCPAIKALLSQKIRTDCPATLLHLHPDVTLICDKQAYEE